MTLNAANTAFDTAKKVLSQARFATLIPTIRLRHVIIDLGVKMMRSIILRSCPLLDLLPCAA